MESSDEHVEREYRTKDGILIFNIRAENVPHYATIQEVKTLFESFGKVTNVRRIENISLQNDVLVANGRNLQPDWFDEDVMYDIHYEKAVSAASALRRTTHYFKEEVIYVQACRSFHQPDGQTIIEQLNKNCFDIPNQPAPIFKLNDDCLEHICQFLTPRDQVNFAISCRRFTSILVSISKTKYKNFDFSCLESLTSFQIYIFLQLVGPQIKCLTVNMALMDLNFDPDIGLGAFLGKSLLNVEKLKVVSASTKLLCKLIENMELLQDLEVAQSSFDKGFIEFLQTLKNLKNLKFVDNIETAGTRIDKLTGLEQLTLHNCPEILLHIKDICKNLVNLNYLDIRRSNPNLRSMDTEDYEHIAKYLVQLKTLKITCNNRSCKSIALLPNLTKLDIIFDFFGNETEFFDYLAIHKADQLEELVVDSRNITKNIATFLVKMKRLKVLRCKFCIDDEFLIKISNLKELEEIEISGVSDFTDGGILMLLENCLTLKRIGLWCNSADRCDLLYKADTFLQKQREQGHRTDCVHFIFKTDSFYTNSSRTPKKLKLSDASKVSYETEFHHYDIIPVDEYSDEDECVDDYYYCGWGFDSDNEDVYSLYYSYEYPFDY